jgi:subtilisin family serine protease
VPGRVLVRFAAEGPHALDACAETESRRGRPLAAATADASDSLDRLHARLGVRRIRALFRRPDGGSFAAQRRRMREGFEGRRRAARTLPDLSHVYRVELGDAVDVGAAVALYRADPHVVWAQPDYRVDVLALEEGLPDDPFYATSGSWGQPYEDLWGLLRIRAAEAWPLARGEGIVVAVNDTGLDYEHPDIASNVWVHPGEDLNGNGIAEAAERNGLDDDGNGFVDDLHGFDFHNSLDADDDGDYGGPDDVSDADPFDDNGHGTHVAGTVAAVGDNGIGVLGVAPRARIMALKGIDENGSGATSDLARAIVYAAQNGARVVNNSWSCSARCRSNPVAEEAVRLAYGLGVVLVFSAGNRSDEVAFYSPQNMRETLVVAASEPGDGIAAFSNHGFGVDVAAPGAGFLVGPPDVSPRSGVLSLLSSQSSPALDGNGQRIVAGEYLRLGGTSMAAPHVAGLAALLLSARPELGPDEVRTALRLTAEDLGAPGHDARSGAGRIDAGRALGLETIPRLRAEISEPGVLATGRLQPGGLEVVGTAAGDDFAAYQLFAGAGPEPEAWVPLGPPRTAPVTDGVLGTWSLEGLAEGRHVLRLSVTDPDGAWLEAFAPLSLERNPARLIGSTGTALRPDVSGSRVVWQSDQAVSEESEGWNLFLADFADPDGLPRPLVSGPLDERRPSLSGDRVVFELLDAGPRGASCTLDSESRCTPQRLGTGTAVAPDVSGERAVWLGTEQSISGILLCEIDAASGGCQPRPIGPSGALRLWPRIDGRRILWSEVVDLGICELGDAGECPARPLGVGDPADPAGGLHDSPSVSGDLVAWVRIARDFRRSDVRLCELDPASGACPVVAIPTLGQVSPPDVSGNRVVWHDVAEPGNIDVFFCEYDRATRSCPVQRLTANGMPQLNPRVDAHRVVWEDGRNGGFPEIYGFELPILEPIPAQRVREGDLLVVEVSGRDPAGDPVALSARQAGGGDLAQVGASFRDLGGGRGELSWRPDFDRAGSHAFHVDLETVGLLHSVGTLEVLVEDVNRAPLVVAQPSAVAAVGQPLRLDACASEDPDGDALQFRWLDRDGNLLGAQCALSLPARTHAALLRLTLEVADGEATQRLTVLARWLPAPAVGRTGGRS